MPDYPPARRQPTAARVVHCKREPYDVYIGRPSKWGNPYVVGRDGDRTTVIELYGHYLNDHPELRIAAREELRGKVLGCYCKPMACHGDLLAVIANEEE